jgi:glucan-binding YG repeat protein
MCVASYAASKISSVRLKVTATLRIGQEIDSSEVEVTTTNSRYYVENYEFINGIFAWEADSVPRLQVTLVAEDDGYFSVSASNITLTGATYVKASYEDSSTTLVITMDLPSMAQQPGTAYNLRWESPTRVVWDSTQADGTYEVRLLRNGSVTGGIKAATQEYYSFDTAVASEGSYSFQVRPVAAADLTKKGDWAEGPDQYVTKDAAQLIKKGGDSWHLDARGWWFQNLDGSWPSSAWRLIGGRWYYFDENGYMYTGWIEYQGNWYYMSPDTGEMVVNESTSDGGYIGPDGIYMTPEAYQAVKDTLAYQAALEAQRANENQSWEDFQNSYGY